MEIVVLLVLSVGSVAFYRRLLPVRAVESRDFEALDVAAVGLLGLWLGMTAAGSFGREVTITREMMIQNTLLFAALIIIIIALLITRDRNPIRVFGLRWEGWARGLGFTMLGLLCLYPVLFLVQIASQKLFGPGVEAQDMVQFFAGPEGAEDRLLVAFMAIVCAPLAEEVIFRGYIHGVARQYLGVWPAIVINAGFFAFIHAHAPSLPGLFLLAVALTLIYERTRSLWAPIVMHAAFNGITLAVTLAFPSLVK